jgi:CRISPR-associated endonuclease Csn1
MTKKILGLDLGTNSIGWALVKVDHENKRVVILGLGSRILTMDAGEINKFETGGKLKSAASQKTTDKTIRKLNERFLLRRDRLHCVLNLMKTLPEHYKVSIDFETKKGYRCGKFKNGTQEKIAYEKDNRGKFHFIFTDAYSEMKKEFKALNLSLFYNKPNGKEIEIPYDWTLYYLRKKALTKEITKEELAWVTLSFNQKRGYTKTIAQDEKLQKEGELSEVFIGKVKSVTEVESKGGSKVFTIILVDENENEIYTYKEESWKQITIVNDLKEVEKTSKYDDEGNINDKDTTFIVKEIRSLKISDVKYTNRKVKENNLFEVELETGWIKEQLSKYLPKWKDTIRDFIIKTTYDTNGNRILKGSDKGRNINAPNADDWTLIKLKTETALSSFNAKNKTVGVASYIYNSLLENPSQKIKGDLVTVIERKYYKEELDAIFNCQKQYHPELKDKELYKKAIELLYPHNENHRNTLKELNFSSLITDDVILYQRDLKSKKSLIADCVYEKENFTKTDIKTGKEYKEPLKAIHKANPYYQEFRLWQFIKRLKILELEGRENDRVVINKDVSRRILTNEKKEELFTFLNNRESITQAILFKHLGISEKEFKWNYEKEKEPCNETRYNFILRLKRVKGFDWKSFLTFDSEYRIWHFFYSVKNQNEFKCGINTLFEKLLIERGFSLEYKDEIVRNFINFGGYANDYGTYSEKAIKKLLPFLRIGKYWEVTKDKIEKILPGTLPESKEKVLEKENIQGELNDFQGLWISSASYLVYNRYSEVGDLQYWHKPDDIDKFLRDEFKQHSLNNPVVEKVLRETLQLVKDIWIHFGNLDADGVYQKLFDRIDIELGREMKKNEKQRKAASNENTENRKTNERIIELLKELSTENGDIRSKSPFQQEKLRILEDGLLSSIEFDKDATVYDFKGDNGSISKKDIKEITTKEISKISKNDLIRYRLWLDQRYQSPYTGEFIKLSDLFNREKYEIEHIFPQEKITLNALYNKVICETEVNKDKAKLGNRTGYKYIIDCNGQKKIKCAAHNNNEITILSKNQYEKLVKFNFIDKRKQEILLSEEIPNEFTNSQLNNAKYIAKIAMKLLSNLVREQGEDSYRSKHVLPVNGVITNKLKKDWQLNEAWNDLIKPRFQRLNEKTGTSLFGEYRKINGHDVFINRVPEEIDAHFDKKRIDHRHHALDALVIALATENHVNYLNNISSQDSKDYKLQARIKIKNLLMDKRENEDGEKSLYFLPPAQTKVDGEIIKYSYSFKKVESHVFKDIALNALESTVVSFKQKNRVINQRTNKYLKWNDEKGKLESESEKNIKLKENYNVRKPLHLATFYGKVKLSNHTKDVSLLDAIKQSENIVNTALKRRINDLKFTNLSIEEIEKELKVQYPRVSIYENYVASRYNNELESFALIESNKILSTIESITDTGIQKILKNHLFNYSSVKRKIKETIVFVDYIVDEQHHLIIKDLLKNTDIIDNIEIEKKVIKETEVFCRNSKIQYENSEVILNPHLAFSPDGVKELNRNIMELNHGKKHNPIFKVRISTPLGTKFPVSEIGEKSKKIVVTAADSNIYCGVYQKENGIERKFVIPTLRESIENLKQGYPPCKESLFDETTQTTYQLLFVLSPNDLVYLPQENEQANPNIIDFENLEKDQINRIYKFRDASENEKGGIQVNFMPFTWANMIFKKDKKSPKVSLLGGKELQGETTLTSDKDKSQNSLDGQQIRAVCWKLEVNRLGQILKITK